MYTTLHISSNKNERFLPIMTYLLLLCCTVSHLGWRAINPHSRCTCPPSSLPQEVWSSRWEVMEQCGSVGGDMTSCQALMQANIWRLLATSLLACRQGPLAWSQKTPWGTYTKGQTWASETGSSSNDGVCTAGVALTSIMKWKQKSQACVKSILIELQCIVSEKKVVQVGHQHTRTLSG